MIEILQENAKLKDVIARVNEVIEQLNKSSDRRGPKSDREMTDDDARAIMKGGEDESLSHKGAAEKRGLSYAQVYSCRKGFTFKHIHKEIADKAKVEAKPE
jgi:hypothetical protein